MKSLTELHSGTVEVASDEVSAGTTFKLRIPAIAEFVRRTEAGEQCRSAGISRLFGRGSRMAGNHRQTPFTLDSSDLLSPQNENQEGACRYAVLIAGIEHALFV